MAIDLGPDGVSSCIDSAGIGFMFAQRYHPAMKSIKAARVALKVCSLPTSWWYVIPCFPASN